MLQTVVYLNSIERIKIYKEGGCQFESNVPGIGWVIDNDACKDWRKALTEAKDAIANTIIMVDTVDMLAEAAIA